MSSTLSALTNISAGKRAWQFASFVLAIVVIIEAITTYHLANNVVTRLIPYGFDTAKGVVDVGPNGKVNLEYVAHITLADVKLLTDWTHKNVKSQYERFLNRCAPEFRASQVIHLIGKADEYSTSANTQVFFPDSPKISDNKSTIVSGRLQRWDGEVKMVDEYIQYTLKYRYIDDIPYIVAMDVSGEPEQKGKAHAK